MNSQLIEISASEYLAAAINAIKDDYKDERQASKAPSFALQYGGTFHTLMKNCGFSKQEAQSICNNYHAMYAVSDQWVADRVREACSTGYVTAAFGLRVRTPLLQKVILGEPNTPFAAEAEARTAGNALGQSWCLLNNRAANEFLHRIDHYGMQHAVRIAAFIHDAIYLIVRSDPKVIAWVNQHLTECMAWQDDPLIQHEKVKISAELDVFFENWAQPITLPNSAVTAREVHQLCLNGARAIRQKQQEE